MEVLDIIKEILISQLQLQDRAGELTADTQLLGAIPEFDSMAVVVLITAIEEELGCTMEDDEIEADIFQSIGTLTNFVESKL